MNRPEHEEWNIDELEDYPEDFVQYGLPLRGEAFVNGVPMITVDAFEVESGQAAAVSAAVAKLANAIPNHDVEDPPRYLLFEMDGEFELGDSRGIIGVVTVRDDGVRLETNLPRHTKALRATIEQAAGKLARFRSRHREDAFAGFLRGS